MAIRRERTLADWLHMVRDGWIALVLALAVGIGLGFAVYTRQPTRYASVATVVVSSRDGFLDLATADKLPEATQTIVRLARRPAVLAQAASSFAASSNARRSTPTVAWVREHVTIGEVANLGIIEITGTGPSQAAATALTSAVAAQVVRVVNATAAAIEGASPRGVLVRTFGAVEPRGKISPTGLRDILIGANAGLLAGIVAAVALGSLRPRLRSARDACDLLGGPVLGRVRVSRRRPISPEDQGMTRASARLIAAEQGGRGGALVLTGATSAKRLATVGTALARSLSASGRKTLVVDGDLVRSAVTRLYRLDDRTGLADLLNGAPEQPADVIAKIAPRGDRNGGDALDLAVLPAGHPTTDPAAALRRRTLPQTINVLRVSHEYVIVVGPQIERAGEVESLVEAADHVIVVGELGTPVERFAPWSDLRDALDGRILGSLLLR